MKWSCDANLSQEQVVMESYEEYKKCVFKKLLSLQLKRERKTGRKLLMVHIQNVNIVLP